MISSMLKRALMAQLDVGLTGDQAAMDSIPAGSGNILLQRLVMKFFHCHAFISTDPRRAVVSFW